MFGKPITLFVLLGFKVQVDFTWLFLALLITWSLAHGFFPAFYEGLATATYWWMGVVGAIGLFFSIVLHELSHSIIARKYGLPITSITLFIFGGVAQMEEEPASPKVEFLMAIAGPIASFFLSVVFYSFAAVAESRELPVPVVGVATYLGFLNGLIAVFNLVPGFPLDGGRVLRSALWHWKGDIRWATRIAANIGAAFGMMLMALGLLNVLGGNFVGGMWWFLIGLFLRGAASTSYHQLIMRRALEGELIRRFMTAKPITVSRELTIRRFLEEYVYEYHHDMFPVTEDSRLLGSVTVRQVKTVPKDAWNRVTVGDIAAPCGSENTIEVNEDAVKALSVMRRTGNSRLMVTERGRLVGIVALKDMLKLLALKIDLGEIG
jgi:Zn-dependent protease